MKNIILLCISLSLLFAETSCKRKVQKSETRTSLSPSSVNFAGITFYLTHEQLSSKLNMLRCSSSDPIVKKCVWRTNQNDREGVFRGIDEIQFTLYRDTVQTITLYYSQMLDIEYKNFNQAVQEKYSNHVGDFSLDTVNTEWTYDSLIVRFMPNRKKHWTNSMYTYTPVLEFQERMLYKRWIDDVEKQRVNALY